MPPGDIESVILRATPGAHPLDVTFIDDEDYSTPWARGSSGSSRLAGRMPESVTATLANLLYFEKSELPQSLVNRLVRLAALQNPEFHRAQAMRMSVWDKPRVIGCAENFPQHIALPRGCLDAASSLLRANGIRLDLHDRRQQGTEIEVDFAGQLRADQDAALAAMLRHDVGAVSVEAILKRVHARYVFGLTATPVRRDGQQPIIFMQCGPIRHRALNAPGAPHALEVLPKAWAGVVDLPADSSIQDVFRSIAEDRERARAIAVVASEGYLLGRKVLAMPISWRGTLQQYVGCLNREHISKTDVQIMDFVDVGHPVLCRMWEKRHRGYRAMGYRVSPGSDAVRPRWPDALAGLGLRARFKLRCAACSHVGIVRRRR